MTNGEMPDVPAAVLAYLQQHDHLSLSTASLAGTPYTATVPYVNDGQALYVAVAPDSSEAQHVAGNPSVSFVIDDTAGGWTTMRSLRGAGRAESIDGPEAARIRDLFAAKYGSEFPSGRTMLAITLMRLELIDNSAESETGPGQEDHRRIIYEVFRGVGEPEVESAVQAMEIQEVAPGEVIVRQGQQGDRFFIISAGEVEVMHEEGGEVRTVARLQQGTYFGELAILRDMPRTATVRAVLPTTLLSMDREAFRAMVARSLDVREDLDEVVQRRLEGLMRPARRPEE